MIVLSVGLGVCVNFEMPVHARITKAMNPANEAAQMILTQPGGGPIADISDAQGELKRGDATGATGNVQSAEEVVGKVIKLIDAHRMMGPMDDKTRTDFQAVATAIAVVVTARIAARVTAVPTTATAAAAAQQQG